MVFQQFPDLTWLKTQTEKRFADRKGWNGLKLDNEGWPTVILNVSTQHTYRDNIRGPLSLFMNLSGASHVESGMKRVRIDEDYFYLTNHDQHYTLDIDNTGSTETFNIHIGEYFADQVFQTLGQKAETLLEKSFEQPQERIEFHNTLRPKTDIICTTIQEIRNTPSPSSIWLDEKLFTIISELVYQEGILHRKQESLPALKSSTREEIFARLLNTVDYIYTNFHTDLSLDTLASVACLSKFHFLRLFKLAFAKTPHQFINDVRLTRAVKLLQSTSLEIKEIARRVGFDDASSFSRIFRIQKGVYPTQIRA
ncbi:MAG TPA: AraC family transcriptional regulator [Ohtaekwangia sp.]